MKTFKAWWNSTTQRWIVDQSNDGKHTQSVMNDAGFQNYQRHFKEMSERSNARRILWEISHVRYRWINGRLTEVGRDEA